MKRTRNVRAFHLEENYMKHVLTALAIFMAAAPAAAELPVGTFTYGGGTPFTITAEGGEYLLSPAPGVSPEHITYQKTGRCYVLTWRDTKLSAGQFCFAQTTGVLDAPTEDIFAAFAVADILGEGYRLILVPGGYQVIEHP